MKNTFKKLLLCFLAAAAVIMGSAAVKSVGNAENSGEPDKNVSLAAAAKQGYCLRDWQGYIAVFEDGRQTPKTVTDIPTEASEMFHFAKSAENPLFTGFLIHTLTTTDKVVKYGENNKIDFSEHPTVVQRGSERTINLYAAVPDVA